VSTQLVGRATELAGLVAATFDGAGAVVSGPAGVGKTALADAVAKQIAATGSRVDWVVATDASRSIPFGALAPLLPDDVNAPHRRSRPRSMPIRGCSGAYFAAWRLRTCWRRPTTGDTR
jgi:putative protein kinase ArgK-like GTPase of G3E family